MYFRRTSAESADKNIMMGTGFIGHLPLDGIDHVVLVTAHHMISDMKAALDCKFTFWWCEKIQVVVEGVDLFAGCDGIHKSCPGILVS